MDEKKIDEILKLPLKYTGSDFYLCDAKGNIIADFEQHFLPDFTDEQSHLLGTLIAEAVNNYDAQAKRIAELEARDRIFVEALSEIKATVDGQTDQPIQQIVEGCLAELAARSVLA